MLKFNILDLQHSKTVSSRAVTMQQPSLTWRRRVATLLYAATLRHFTSGLVGGKLLLLTWSFLRVFHFLAILCNVHSALFKRTACQNCDIVLKFTSIWQLSWVDHLFLQYSMSTLQCIAVCGDGFNRTRATNRYQSSVTHAQHCPSTEPTFFSYCHHSANSMFTAEINAIAFICQQRQRFHLLPEVLCRVSMGIRRNIRLFERFWNNCFMPIRQEGLCCWLPCDTSLTAYPFQDEKRHKFYHHGMF